MGEPQDAWPNASRPSRPTQVNAAVMEATGNPDVRFMHCLPSYHDRNTVIGERIFQQTGRPELQCRRGVQQRGVHRVRPGREPDALDQAVLIATLAGE